MATLTACSDAFPAEAVAAWQGPGNEPDVRRWALAYAILAPNSHNRQPWRVDVREPNTIILYVDRGTAMGFIWLSTPTARHATAGTPRSAEVQAGRAYMRLQLKATELGLQVHPMRQAPQEFSEMNPWYDRLHTLLVGKSAGEETVQLFCRIGYCAGQQHTPRRDLLGFLKA